MHYSNLGAAPEIAKRKQEKVDPLLARTGPVARKLLRLANRSPAKLSAILARVDPQLPTRVHYVAQHLNRSGMTADVAVERAVALALADETIERFKAIGRRVQQGMPPATAAMSGLGGLGGLGDEAADTVARMFQGVACSDNLRTSISDAVGRNEGRDAADATNIGLSIGQGMAQCSTLAPATTPEPETPPPEEEPASTSLFLPIMLGIGGIAVVGGVAWWVTRKK